LERYLISADVYRRDEIDASHYPVFHQMEGASVWTRQQLAELPALNARLREHIASSPSPLILIDDTHPPDPETNPSQPEHDVETRDLIVENLKLSLNSLILTLFRSHTDQKGEPLQVKWIPATFPWTAPSYEVEVLYEGKWLEILGSGVVKQDTLQRAGQTPLSSPLCLFASASCSFPTALDADRLVPPSFPLSPVLPLLSSRSDCSDKMGWAFGLGLERLAMILFSIPDIRLFWSTDPRFLSQFSDPSTSTSPSSSHTPDVPKTAQSSHTSSDVQSSQKKASVPESTEHAKLPLLRKFVPFSRYPECKKDVSFWLPTEEGVEWHENDFCDGVRDVAGDVVEGVRLVRSRSSFISCPLSSLLPGLPLTYGTISCS
jgi:phenylalanyl-tRNA synthetase alpha chain